MQSRWGKLQILCINSSFVALTSKGPSTQGLFEIQGPSWQKLAPIAALTEPFEGVVTTSDE